MSRLLLWLAGLLVVVAGTPLLAQPSNDNCANALSISIGGCRNNQTTQGATLQSGENTGCATGVGSSVWYYFQAGASDSVLRLTIDVTAVNRCYGSAVVYGPYNNAPNCLPANAQQINCDNVIYGLNFGGGGSNSAYYVDVPVVPGRYYMVQVLGATGGPCNGAHINFNICLSRACNHCGSLCVTGVCNYPSNTAPSTSWVTSNCTPATLTPPADSYSDVQQCFSFTAVNTTMNLTGAVTSTCGSAQFYSLYWTLYSDACGYIRGPVNFFGAGGTQITGLTPGQTYRICMRYEISLSSPGNNPCSIIQLYLATYAAPLPVVLADYRVQCRGDAVELQWATAVEEAVAYFTLERRLPGGDTYEPVARVLPRGGPGLKTYAWTDEMGVPRGTRYRLVEVTLQGQEVVLAEGEVGLCGQESVRWLVQEAGLTAALFSDKSGVWEVSLYDLQGQEMFSNRTYLGAGGHYLPVVEGLRPGLYLCRVQSPTGQVHLGRVLVP